MPEIEWIDWLNYWISRLMNAAMNEPQLKAEWSQDSASALVESDFNLRGNASST